MRSTSIKGIDFVKSVEIVPKKTGGVEDLIRAGDEVGGIVNAMTCPENPRGAPAIDPIISLYMASMEKDVIVMPHITPRDKNLLYIYSQLLTAKKLGITNLLLLGGDPIDGKYASKEVREVDVIQLARKIKEFDPHFTIGGALNPYREKEEEIVRAKQRAGFDFFISQAVFSENYLKKEWIKRRDFKLIAGFLPLHKKAQIQFSDSMGIEISGTAKEKLLAGDDVRGNSIKMIRNIFEALDGYVDGIHIMPLGHNDIAREILETI